METLSEHSNWIADGTFYVSPRFFPQSYTSLFLELMYSVFSIQYSAFLINYSMKNVYY